MTDYLYIFKTMATLFLAIALLCGGAITLYFGSKKSRGMGAILAAVGGVVLILSIWLINGFFAKSVPSEFWGALIGLFSAIFGGVIGLGVFLLVLLKT
jgi:hypothetical protein